MITRDLLVRMKRERHEGWRSSIFCLGSTSFSANQASDSKGRIESDSHAVEAGKTIGSSNSHRVGFLKHFTRWSTPAPKGGPREEMEGNMGSDRLCVLDSILGWLQAHAVQRPCSRRLGMFCLRCFFGISGVRLQMLTAIPVLTTSMINYKAQFTRPLCMQRYWKFFSMFFPMLVLREFQALEV